MTLADYCEPVFQYVCKLNRMARRGGKQDFGIIRAEIKALIAECGQKAQQKGGYAREWPQAEMILIFFVDSMIMNSKLVQHAQWKPISAEIQHLGFEEEFWDILEDVLKDPTEQATQILGVFYQCIGLGFTGLYTNQPDVIKRKMLEISARLRGVVDADAGARICPEAYENVDTRNLTQSPVRSLTGLTLVAVLLLVVVIISYYFFFSEAGKNLDNALSKITTSWENQAVKKTP